MRWLGIVDPSCRKCSRRRCFLLTSRTRTPAQSADSKHASDSPTRALRRSNVDVLMAASDIDAIGPIKCLLGPGSRSRHSGLQAMPSCGVSSFLTGRYDGSTVPPLRSFGGLSFCLMMIEVVIARPLDVGITLVSLTATSTPPGVNARNMARILVLRYAAVPDLLAA